MALLKWVKEQNVQEIVATATSHEAWVLRIVITRIAKSRSQGNRSRLRGFSVGYSPRIGFHKVRSRQVRLRLVLVQKRTHLEFLWHAMGHLYTWGFVNTTKEMKYKYKGGTS